MIGKTIDELKIGDTEEFSKTISESDIYIFAGVTGDLNPAHINETYAEKTHFKTRIAHGMLLAGFISTVVGNKLPGYGTIYIRQELNFLAPVGIGETITSRVTVEEIMTEKKQVRLKTTCINQMGTIVLDGEAIVSPPRPMRN
jgi:3-hydroxybutyryl-CoA dehydratase